MEFKHFWSENPVWDYFQRSTNDEGTKCDTCGTNISYKGGSTGVWETTCIWNARFRLMQKDKKRMFLLWQSVLQVKARSTTFVGLKKLSSTLQSTVYYPAHFCGKSIQCMQTLCYKTLVPPKWFNNQRNIFYFKSAVGKINITNLCFFVVLHKASWSTRVTGLCILTAEWIIWLWINTSIIIKTLASCYIFLRISG